MEIMDSGFWGIGVWLESSSGILTELGVTEVDFSRIVRCHLHQPRHGPCILEGRRTD